MKKEAQNWQFHGFLGGLVGGFVIFLLFILIGGVSDAEVRQGIFPDGRPNAIYAIDVSDVVEQVNPSVVAITVRRQTASIDQMNSDPFEQFFGFHTPFQYRVPHLRQQANEWEQVGAGSGFITTEDGYIVTNSHVINERNARYTVTLHDGRELDASLVAQDPFMDLAVLKVDANRLQVLEFGDSDEIRLGQTVIAIGNALAEFKNTVSVGVISGLSRTITPGSAFGQAETLENIIQTDAAINPGNSGGPLLDISGNIIGVNVAVVRGSENIGFALPANAVREAVEQMIEHGQVIRPYLGVRYIPVNSFVQEEYDLPVNYGALIMQGDAPGESAIVPESPAEQVGLREGDVILEVDGARIDANSSLVSLIRRKSVGDQVSLRILRDGREFSQEVTLEAPHQ